MFLNNESLLVKISNLLNGLSKTVGIIDKAVPLYKKAGPILRKTNSLINGFKDNKKRIDNNDDSKIKKIDNSNNLPIFFS